MNRCIWVTIDRDSPTVADISDVNTSHICTDKGNPPKSGGIYVRLMVKFIKQNAKQLGVKTITLTDYSSHYCLGKRNFSIQLEVSRQLEGKYPYYVQFGFKPLLSQNTVILKRNRQIMRSFTTSERLIDFCHGYKNFPNIIDYIINHKDQPLTETLMHIGKMDCVFFSGICRALFRELGLEELEEPIYVMKI